MRKYILLSFLLFSFVEAKLPSYEMQRICKDEVVAKYDIQRSKIHLAVPRYLYGKYSVYGQSPKGKKNALFFVCDFSRSGRLLAVKTEKDLRRRGNNVSTKNAKRSCKSEAASVWRVPRSSVRIVNTRKVKSSRYHISVASGKRKALCDVNAQGNIYRFTRERNTQKLPREARRACLSSASRFWQVPRSRIKIESVRRNNHGRYTATLRYRNISAKCDVDRYGDVHHFRTRR